MSHQNLAVEPVQKLLRGEVSSLRLYLNLTMEAAQVIEELIEFAKDVKQAKSRGERLGLSEDSTTYWKLTTAPYGHLGRCGQKACERLSWLWMVRAFPNP